MTFSHRLPVYLALPLLVTRLGLANDTHSAPSLDNLAIATDFFNRRSNFHNILRNTGTLLALAVTFKIRFFHQVIILFRHQVRLNLRHKIHHHNDNDQQ